MEGRESFRLLFLLLFNCNVLYIIFLHTGLKRTDDIITK